MNCKALIFKSFCVLFLFSGLVGGDQETGQIASDTSVADGNIDSTATVDDANQEPEEIKPIEPKPPKATFNFRTTASNVFNFCKKHVFAIGTGLGTFAAAAMAFVLSHRNQSKTQTPTVPAGVKPQVGTPTPMAPAAGAPKPPVIDPAAPPVVDQGSAAGAPTPTPQYPQPPLAVGKETLDAPIAFREDLPKRAIDECNEIGNLLSKSNYSSVFEKFINVRARIKMAQKYPGCYSKSKNDIDGAIGRAITLKSSIEAAAQVMVKEYNSSANIHWIEITQLVERFNEEVKNEKFADALKTRDKFEEIKNKMSDIANKMEPIDRCLFYCCQKELLEDLPGVPKAISLTIKGQPKWRNQLLTWTFKMNDEIGKIPK